MTPSNYKDTLPVLILVSKDLSPIKGIGAPWILGQDQDKYKLKLGYHVILERKCKKNYRDMKGQRRGSQGPNLSNENDSNGL